MKRYSQFTDRAEEDNQGEWVTYSGAISDTNPFIAAIKIEPAEVMKAAEDMQKMVPMTARFMLRWQNKLEDIK